MGLIPIIFKVISLFTVAMITLITVSYILYKVKKSKAELAQSSQFPYQPQPVYAADQQYKENTYYYPQPVPQAVYEPVYAQAAYAPASYMPAASAPSINTYRKNRFQVVNAPRHEYYYPEEMSINHQAPSYSSNGYDIYRNYSNNHGERLQMVKVVA